MIVSDSCKEVKNLKNKGKRISDRLLEREFGQEVG